MFLDVLLRRNSSLVEAAVELHQRGEIPANSYVIDVDTVKNNAAILSEQAKRYNFKVFAMTKQIGRNPIVLKAMKEAGIESCVGVDMMCARAVKAAGLKVGHLGHLVQVPKWETAEGLELEPEFWTVFSLGRAEFISQANHRGKSQKLLARVFAEKDIFYKGHEGGFPAEDIVEDAKRINTLPGIELAGITTFPALLYNHDMKYIVPTHNLTTLERTAERLRKSGMGSVEINAPGTTSSISFETLANAGVTQIEPGHGLTGTTPLHAITDLPERPAMVYLSEVSHIHNGKPYCFGGGMYIDPVFPQYPVKACVGSDAGYALGQKITCDIPEPSSIDYYGILQPEPGNIVREGDSVVFGFRAQTFVTRAYMVPVSGLSQGRPNVEGVWTVDGRKAGWPKW